MEIPTRPETGPMKFEGDWSGVFLRGDYAGPMAFYLEQVLKDSTTTDTMAKFYAQQLLDTLRGADERTNNIQTNMKPFSECYRAPENDDNKNNNNQERGH